MDEQLGRGTTTDDGFGLFLHLLFVSFSCILDTMTYLQLMTALAFCVFLFLQLMTALVLVQDLLGYGTFRSGMGHM